MSSNNKKILKRLLIVEPVVNYGGMNLYVDQLANALVENQCEVGLATSNYYAGSESVYTKVSKVFGDCFSGSLISKIKSYVKGIILVCQDKDFNVVNVHAFGFPLLKIFELICYKISRKKIILTIHDIKSFAENGDNSISKFFDKLKLRSVGRLADVIWLHNEFTFKELKNYVGDVCSSKVILANHGNYSILIGDNVERPIRDVNSNYIVNLLFFGQVKKVKGLDILLEAISIVCKRRQDFKLSVYGKVWKDDEFVYHNIVNDNDLADVVDLNFRYVADEEIESIICKSDLVILPYKRIYQSGVLLLCGTFATPCIASDLPFFRSIIKDGCNGLLFESENPVSLAQKIESVLEDKSQIEGMSKRFQSDVLKEYSWHDAAKKIAKVI